MKLQGFFKKMVAFSFAFALFAVAQAQSSVGTVLVTGAAGRTGRQVYSKLKAQGVDVRAMVYNISTAKAALNCSKCDASEGIFQGDVTNPASLIAPTAGVSAVAICVGSGAGVSVKEQAAIEWHGVESQLKELVYNGSKASSVADKQVVLISSMGTTQRFPLPFEGGGDLFWKEQGEIFLATSGIKTTVIKPCGLADGASGQQDLMVGHDDELLAGGTATTVTRSDVADVMVAAVMQQATGLRFDLCGGKMGTTRHATPVQLLQEAKWPWARGSSIEEL